jgi:hypothetical protein
MDDQTSIRDWSDPPDFDWSTAGDDIVIRRQQETAAYLNDDRSAVVIRQNCWPDEDDAVVIVNVEALPQLLARLNAIGREVERDRADERGQLDLFGAGAGDDEWREPIAAHLAGKTRTTLTDIADVVQPGYSCGSLASTHCRHSRLTRIRTSARQASTLVGATRRRGDG